MEAIHNAIGNLLNEHDVARITGLSVASVRRWRLLRQGPRYLKIGTAVRYLRYVTLEQVFSQFWTILIPWLISSILVIGCGAAGKLGTTAFGLNGVPAWVWYVILIAAFLWVARGRTLTISIPKFRFGGWLCFNLAITGLAAGFYYLPWWAGFPVYIGIAICFELYEKLLALGKQNYQLLRVHD